MSSGDHPRHCICSRCEQEFTGTLGATLESTSEYKPTKLEYFAGLAMQAVVSNSTTIGASYEAIATCSLLVAKALIAELDKAQ
jgi:hypothetical protein